MLYELPEPDPDDDWPLDDWPDEDPEEFSGIDQMIEDQRNDLHEI